tara:strand:+ start:111 stop:338 length:228 start_codon:yes stop_codon:yes gene_type:complete
MLRSALGRARAVLPAVVGLFGTSSALVLSSAAMESAPVDNVTLVTPFPGGDVTGTTLQLHEIAAGRPVVLHMFTG